jgi:hypothetical protein
MQTRSYPPQSTDHFTGQTRPSSTQSRAEGPGRMPVQWGSLTIPTPKEGTHGPSARHLQLTHRRSILETQRPGQYKQTLCVFFYIQTSVSPHRQEPHSTGRPQSIPRPTMFTRTPDMRSTSARVSRGHRRGSTARARTRRFTGEEP